ncbi:MAG: tRNA pseudouridine synthase A [Candidatus Thorarchaeota archaeon]
MAQIKYLFKMYYIGSKFHGSQRQLNVSTVEEQMILELKKKNYLTDVRNSEFEFASRTDRYVSARGACFTCITNKKPILMEINSGLPHEMGVWAYSEVPTDFSARRNAVLRKYLYIYPTPISYLKKTNELDIRIMNKACKILEGCHDFVNFAKRETNVVNTVKDMKSVVLSAYDDYLIFQFISKSFLRQQIRRTVKKLIELGTNVISFEDFLKLLNNEEIFSYQPAEPDGLILWDIEYDQKIIFKEDEKSKEKMRKYFYKKQISYGLKSQLFRILQQDNFS